MFKVLCSVLVVLVLIILGSALKRMMLYDEAYGLTRLRTYTLAGLGWIAILLLGFSWVMWRGSSVRFAQLLAAVALGFTATLGILNVDAFIAGRNFERSIQGEDLDIWHMTTLTDDSVPVIAGYVQDHPELVDNQLLEDVICRQLQRNQEQFQDWQAYHFSRAAADTATEALEQELGRYTVAFDEWGDWLVVWKGGQFSCPQWRDWD